MTGVQTCALRSDHLFERHALLFVRLELQDAAGAMVADNFYWVAKDAESYRALDKLASASVNSDMKAAADVTVYGGREKVWRVHMRNTGSDAAVALKLTLRHTDGTRILPAYYSDNYISLLPGEERTVSIHAPVDAAGSADDARISVRGWNLPEQDVPLDSTRFAQNHAGGAEVPSPGHKNIH